jgi:hypothetical protein
MASRSPEGLDNGTKQFTKEIAIEPVVLEDNAALIFDNGLAVMLDGAGQRQANACLVAPKGVPTPPALDAAARWPDRNQILNTLITSIHGLVVVYDERVPTKLQVTPKGSDGLPISPGVFRDLVEQIPPDYANAFIWPAIRLVMKEFSPSEDVMYNFINRPLNEQLCRAIQIACDTQAAEIMQRTGMSFQDRLRDRLATLYLDWES